MFRNEREVCIIKRPQQGYFQRQKVLNTENKEVLIVPWYSKEAKGQKYLEKFL